MHNVQCAKYVPLNSMILCTHVHACLIHFMAHQIHCDTEPCIASLLVYTFFYVQEDGCVHSQSRRLNIKIQELVKDNTEGLHCLSLV